MKVLIYRIGGLGDSILTFPVIEILNKKGYDITVWGNPEYFILCRMAGFCNKVTFYEPKEKFDFAIVFSKNRAISGFSENSIYVKPIPEEEEWVVKWYLKKLNLSEEPFSNKLNLGLKVEKKSNLCIIHPGSGSIKKAPEKTFFIELANLIRKKGFEILFLVGPAERKTWQEGKDIFYSDNIIEVAETLLKASLYIGVDSGISHLSSYLGVPSIVIFGPTNPKVWHPIGVKTHLIRESSCPPCFPNTCENRKCLDKNFLIEQVINILEKNLVLEKRYLL
ncbi:MULTISPECIES: glycosyltransferase family 9 protein [Thermodesulfovibrio]|jgi:ADP-heptose:LPS heptosyltransferase|uniref:glycosyltransferase family 9 protein n=1 Tax=Thermodesulfovibrio TaxID=28261 RepID=UPI0026249352|nr:glycosyltransferase family 9 protein [Thermodesulfovibrio sp.]